MEIWHKRIKELREKSDVTLKDMAKIIGVSEATVQRYESGKIQELPYKVIVAYAEKFKVFPSYIMGWTDDPKQYSLYDAERNIDFHTMKATPQVINPQPQYVDERLQNCIRCLKSEVMKRLVEVAYTCREDDVEMVISLLKYFRIRG